VGEKSDRGKERKVTGTQRQPMFRRQKKKKKSGAERKNARDTLRSASCEGKDHREKETTGRKSGGA